MSWFRSSPPLTWLRLHFGHDLDPVKVRRFLVALLASGDIARLVFEIEGGKQAIFRIGSSNAHRVRHLLRVHLDEVVVSQPERTILPPSHAWAVKANTAQRPLASSDLEGSAATILGSLAVSGAGATKQIVVGRRSQPQLTPEKPSSGFGENLTKQLATDLLSNSGELSTEAHKVLAAKREQPQAMVNLRFVLPANEDGQRPFPSHFAGAMQSMATPGLRLRLARESDARAHQATPSSKQLTLNVDELMAVLGWPYGDISYPGVDRTRSLTRPVVQRRDPQRILGRSAHPGKPIDLSLSPRDAMRHMHVLGPSGVGKSTLLLQLALQDIASNRSVVVIDPKGDLVDDILARVPEKELQRVVLLDPSRQDRIVGFNPLQATRSNQQLAVDNILHVFKNLHSAAWGPRSQDILHASLLTLVGTPYNSLTLIPRLLTDGAFRKKVLGEATLSSELGSYWQWFNDLPAGERSTMTAPLLNKLRPFTLRPSLRATLSASKPFDLKRVFIERKVLLVPLRKGLIGSEVSELFGSLLFASLWQATQSRSSVSPQRRHRSFIYADEFQDYTRLPTDFGDVLAQARGLGVGLILAHQNLSQLEPQLRSILSANAQNKVYFRLGTEDATTIARNVDALGPGDFARLPAFEAYAQALEDDQLRPFASMRTFPPTTPVRDPRATANALAGRDGTPLSEIEKTWATPPTTHPNPPDDLDNLGRKPRGPK